MLGALTLAFGVVGNSVDRPSRAVSLWSPLCITLTIVLAGYSVFLLRRFVAPPTLAAGAAGELRALRAAGVGGLRAGSSGRSSPCCSCC